MTYEKAIGKYGWFNRNMLMDGEVDVDHFECNSVSDALKDCQAWHSVEGGVDEDEGEDASIIYVFKLEALYRVKNEGIVFDPITPKKKAVKKGAK